MNLASRLDRLRGRTPQSGVGDASGAGSDEDLLANRLRRVRRGPRSQGREAAPLARLAQALCAEIGANGLLSRERVHRLDGPAATGTLCLLPEVCGLAAPEWVYIDTETTGLSGGVGNLAFMVGVGRYTTAGALDIKQFVLGSFAAEQDMLRVLLDWLGPRTVLVSYNGKSFDLPLLTARLGMHRLADHLGGLPQLDLMYNVRRAYRRHWPDCRLQTAEQRLLSLHRLDDLPGAEAPAAWRAWLEQGAVSPMSGVLAHNFQDVASLALLHRRLVEDYAGSGRIGIDHAAIARAWCEAGRTHQARTVLECAGDALEEPGLMLLAYLYRRAGEWPRAESIWRDLYRRGCAAAASELSKYYEHRVRDYREAMGFAHGCEQAERTRRVTRLERKLGANLPLPW